MPAVQLMLTENDVGMPEMILLLIRLELCMYNILKIHRKFFHVNWLIHPRVINKLSTYYTAMNMFLVISYIGYRTRSMS